MAHYILLVTLEADGREKLIDDPHALRRSVDALETPQTRALGLYAVLGRFDFVLLVDSDDNEHVARFSLALSRRAGVNVETLPAIPIAELDDRDDRGSRREPERREIDPPWARERAGSPGGFTIPSPR
ncbi:MAG: GYD domain-containing protein [Dehalococcoidia bacterium]